MPLMPTRWYYKSDCPDKCMQGLKLPGDGGIKRAIICQCVYSATGTVMSLEMEKTNAAEGDPEGVDEAECSVNTRTGVCVTHGQLAVECAK